MQPNDSPIWSLLSEEYPELPQQIREQVYMLLSKSKIPTTDKIFPWIMETTILRVQLGHTRQEIHELRQTLDQVPKQVGKSVGDGIEQAMQKPVQSMGILQAFCQELLVQLQKAAITEANLKTAGWRGIGAAIGAIFRVQSLAIVVGVISICSAGVGGAMVWRVTEEDRQIIQYNKEVIERCHRDYAADEDLNGWYTCPKFQVPMPENINETSKQQTTAK